MPFVNINERILGSDENIALAIVQFFKVNAFVGDYTFIFTNYVPFPPSEH